MSNAPIPTPPAPESETVPNIPKMPAPTPEPEILSIALPQCAAVIYFGTTVVMRCSQPQGHTMLPGDQVHAITVQWREEEAHVNLPEKPVELWHLNL